MVNPQWPIRIRGTGKYIPKAIRTNADFVAYLDTSDEWIVTRTGIKERHVAAPDEAASTLGIHAAQAALEDAGLGPEDIDLIVCATATGDYHFPATAAVIQGGIGATHAAAFDVSAACAGFLHGLAVATGQIASGIHRRALVIGTEVLTRFADPEDRTTIVLFGDAAGAAVIERSDNPEQGILHLNMGCDGTRFKHIWVPAGGSVLPSSATTSAERLEFLRMRGQEVYKFAVVKMQELIDNALVSSGLDATDIKQLIPHQSNFRIIESVRKRMGLAEEQVTVNIDRYGNTSAASIPIGLDEARRSGALQEGDLVLMIAIGAGLVWATVVMRL